MNGIVVLNKPVGISSHDCVNLLRRTFSTKKVGHAGTLDKEASGVLVLGINKGTKIMPYLNQDDKGYAFTVVFNQATDTLDHSGEILEEKTWDDFSSLDNVLKAFLGPYEQQPPAYSAVKHQGKKLYEYARNNQAIPKVKPRDVYVYSLKPLSNLKKRPNGTYEIDLFVESSKGLYVRQLAMDIAKAIGTVAHTMRIHRTQSGQFAIEDATEIEELKAGKIKILSLHEALRSLPAIEVSDEDIFAIKNGQKLTLKHDASTIKLIDKNAELLAIYRQVDGAIYKAEKVFLQ